MLGDRARFLGSSDVRFYVLLTAALDAQTPFFVAGRKLVVLTAAVAVFTQSATRTKTTSPNNTRTSNEGCLRALRLQKHSSSPQL